MPELQADTPSAEWRLGETGRARAHQLARYVDPGDARVVFASREPKAIETADIMAAAWGLEAQPVAGLHEHERPLPELIEREAYEERIRDLFARPSERVFGAESADEARRRFTMAVMRLVTSSRGDVVAVTHGTVLTLFVAEAVGVEPFAFWRRLGLPCAVTLSLPDLKLAAVTNG
jgi:broad specificity phosphatase PhoE